MYISKRNKRIYKNHASHPRALHKWKGIRAESKCNRFFYKSMNSSALNHITNLLPKHSTHTEIVCGKNFFSWEFFVSSFYFEINREPFRRKPVNKKAIFLCDINQWASVNTNCLYEKNSENVYGQREFVQQGEGAEADKCKQWLDAVVS